ncbi:reverse transcriptase domain, reverse transcriptase zinc-binding domain protein [Tanacetum coccineum]
MSDSFRYHKQCEDLNIINLCFADDLFLFARGDLDSTKGIMDSLDEFKQVSGLIPSIPKITAYFCNVSNHVKISILNIMPFAEGKLPVKYLGVPLISSRLFNRDCKILIEKARNRIGDWKNKSLSFAGRLQLCKSVILSMQVYWASVLVIPMGIINDIQQLFRGFLWCNGEYKRGKAKVAWDDIFLPKREGGLGLRSLEDFNLALMTTHIWNIVSNKESLWAIFSNHVFADLISNGMWNWPSACFSVKCAWEALRSRGHEVTWYSTIWFSNCIPRHAFQLWLIMRRSLRTQDKLKPWDVGDSIDLSWLRCSLCGLQPDSHEHLFFKRVYSSKIWCVVRQFAGMESVPPVLEDIMLWFQPMATKHTFKNIVGKLRLS